MTVPGPLNDCYVRDKFGINVGAGVRDIGATYV